MTEYSKILFIIELSLNHDCPNIFYLNFNYLNYLIFYLKHDLLDILSQKLKLSSTFI